MANIFQNKSEVFSKNENTNFLVLVQQLEDYATQSQNTSLDPGAMETATRLRNLIVRDVSEISYDGKIHLVKLVNKLKVRALLHEGNEGYRMFSHLESIGNDILQVF